MKKYRHNASSSPLLAERTHKLRPKRSQSSSANVFLETMCSTPHKHMCVHTQTHTRNIQTHNTHACAPRLHTHISFSKRITSFAPYLREDCLQVVYFAVCRRVDRSLRFLRELFQIERAVLEHFDVERRTKASCAQPGGRENALANLPRWAGERAGEPNETKTASDDKDYEVRHEQRNKTRARHGNNV